MLPLHAPVLWLGSLRARPQATLLVLSLAIIPGALPMAPAGAQEVGGHLEGRVVRGAVPLQGASVTVTCSHLPGPRTTRTSGQGRFLVRGLPPGSCEAAVGADGFRTTRITSIHIELGLTTSIGDVSLDPQVLILDEILVTARRGVDPASASVTATLAAEDFARLPNDQWLPSVLPFAAQVETSWLPGDDANVAGGTGPETVYYIDGVNVTEVSLASGGVQIPLSFIEEVQVTSGGTDAAAPGGMGGAVSLVTRGGGSRLHGAVFGGFSSDWLSAAPRLSSSSATEVGYQLLEPGGVLWGPIVPGRLSFFVGYQPGFHRQRIALAGLPTTSAGRTTHALAGKTVWRMSDRGEASLSVFGDPGSRDAVEPFFATDSVRNLEAVASNGRVGGVVATGRTRWRVGTHGDVTIRMSRQWRADDSGPATARGRDEALFFDVPANALGGGLGLESRLRTARSSGGVAVSTTRGRHFLRAGIEHERGTYDYAISYGLGSDGLQGLVMRLDDTTYQWVRGHDAGSVANSVNAAFLGDGWSVGDRLILSGGVRWSDQRLLSSTGSTLQRFPGQWQPRLALVWQPGRPGTQRVRLAAGRIYEIFPANLARLFQQGRQQLITMYDHDPRVDPAGADTVYALLSPSLPPAGDIEGQSLDEVLVGYDRLIGGQWTVGLWLQHRWLRWAVEDTFDPLTGEPLVGNPGRGALSFLPRARHEYSALAVQAVGSVGRRVAVRGSYVLSRTYGNYEGLYDYAALESFPNTSLQVDTPEQVANGTGPLPNDHTHTLKVQAMFDWRAGVAIGIGAAVMSGTPRNRLGASSFGAPSYVFLQPRGSAGRTPSLADFNVRVSWTMPAPPPTLRLTVDLYHIGNRRSAVRYDDALYLAQDGNGNQTVANPNYGRGLAFQPPFSARLGFLAEF